MNKSLPSGSVEGELIARRERARFTARKQLQPLSPSSFYWVYASMGVAMGVLVSQNPAHPWMSGISTFGAWMAVAAYHECAILRKRQDAMLTLLLESQPD